MMKLSITLPNNVFITLESEGSGPVHEVLAQVLGSVQFDTYPAGEAPPRRDTGREDGVEKSSGVPYIEELKFPVDPPDSRNGWDRGMRQDSDATLTALEMDGYTGRSNGESGDRDLDVDRYSRQAQEDFMAFCQAINPTGDMRRVVVAAVAANRFFELEGVTADEVGELFDLIGWRRANSFTQTIRNAARSKFGWLERIPGKAGRYAATDVGRSTTLSG